MLKGMARGKVGDVVFSRLNGEQIARVRNRNPKNPKTNAQLYQRAIMATVMAGYSAGKVIFDHSFQGFSTGEANQRRFMSLNAKRLRGILANDLSITTESERTISAFNAPGVNTPAPALFQISEGNYPQKAFVNAAHGMVVPLEGETVAKYAARVGLLEGDIYTIVGFTSDRNQQLFEVRGVSVSQRDVYPYIQYGSNFFFLRLQVKAGLAAVTTVVTAQTPLTTFFDVTDSMNTSLMAKNYICHEGDDGWLANILTDEGGYTIYSVAGIIRSRLDQDLRSTSYMEQVYGYSEYEADRRLGIAAPYLLDAWKQGAQQVGDSDLILEGGDR